MQSTLVTSHIIDAYNLIFQCGLHPKSLGTGKAMRQAHDRLLQELARRFHESQRNDVVIVFDAKRKPNESDQVPGRGFRVRFAWQYDDADTMIIDLIRRHSQPKQLTVVSSDHQIQTAASRRGAIAIDSDEWFDSMPQHVAGTDEPIENSQPLLDKEEQQQWIEQMQRDLESEANTKKKTADDDQPSTFNPFPDGYADDLL